MRFPDLKSVAECKTISEITLSFAAVYVQDLQGIKILNLESKSTFQSHIDCA